MARVKAWRGKSVLEKRTALGRLIDIIGDKTTDQLSYKVATAFKKDLMKLPANIRKDPRYRDLPIKKIVKLKNLKPMAVNTVNNNISHIIAFMNWAKRHGYISENYFEGLKVPKGKKARDQRKAFTTRDLRKISHPENYLKATKKSNFRYWIPLMALFSGARLGELAQLHKSDVIKEQGIWCFNFTEEGGTEKNPKKLKNDPSERKVPVHPLLIELGFIEFVQHAKKDKKEVRLFSDLSFNSADYYSRQIGRWFNQFYLRKTLGIIDPAKSFHSFRHTVADCLKQKGIAMGFVEELLGHGSGSSQSFGRYGKQYRPKVLMDEVVKKIEYKIGVEKLKDNRIS